MESAKVVNHFHYQLSLDLCELNQPIPCIMLHKKLVDYSRSTLSCNLLGGSHPSMSILYFASDAVIERFYFVPLNLIALEFGVHSLYS